MSTEKIKPQKIVSTEHRSTALREDSQPLSKQEVINILKANLNNFAAFGVIEIGLFGSFVREEQTIDSDIDLLVNLQNHSWDNYWKLIDFTESLFKGIKIDLIAENSISGYEGINICKEVEYVT